MVPQGGIFGILLAVLFLYLFFRHLMFILMIWDLIIGWLRQFRWFPKEGKRMRTFVHWLIAIGLFLGYLWLARTFGWIEFVPV